MPPKGEAVLIYGPNGMPAIFDNVFNIPVSQDIEHYMAHEGLSYERHISSANLPVTSLNVAFKTLPGNKLAHMLFGFDMNDEVKLEIFEGAIWTQGTGTALDIIRINRNAGEDSTVILEDKNQPTFTASNQVIKDVTITTPGLLIDPDRYTYNAALGAAISAETRRAGHEWPLKKDTTYVAKMLKTDDDCKMTINLHWYEK